VLFSETVTALLINGGLPLGGTWVNVGCVPSKFLVRAAESIHHASVSNFDGITTAKPTINFAEIIKQKTALVNDMQQRKYVIYYQAYLM
jgi:mercuric reductase